MAKAIMLVETRPADPSREAEYNDWYDNTHLPEVCAVPGIVGARRYKLRDDADGATSPYLAIYELDADDVTAPMDALRERSASGEMHMSDVLAMEPPPVVTIYELITERTPG